MYLLIKNVFFLVPKKSESADIEEPKLENEETNEEEINIHISPTPADRKSPTGKTSKVTWSLGRKYRGNIFFKRSSF